MKVKDLIHKLEQTHPDIDVFASPLVFLPSMEFDTEAVTLSGEAVMRIPNPKQRFPVVSVGAYFSIQDEDNGKAYLILAYDEDELPRVEPAEEFVN